ncbi:MAG: phosphatidate cytidylyltransferase [Acidobacteriota bacterium]
MVAVFYFDDHLDAARGGVLFAALIVLMALGTAELRTILRAKSHPFDPGFFLVATGAIGLVAIVYLTPWFYDHGIERRLLPLTAAWLLAVLIAALIRHAVPEKRTDGAIIVGSLTLFAVVYIAAGPSALLFIRAEHGAWVVLALLAITKCCDIGAYLTGVAIGRNKLIPWLSPGKTWEGLIGGILFSAAVAAGLSLLDTRYPLSWAIITGALLAISGQLGDLTASLFKRDADLKDSGKAVPGFGGVLDIVDSPIVAAPVGYWLLQLV